MGTVEPTGPTAITWAMETYSEAQGKAADTVELGAAPGWHKVRGQSSEEADGMSGQFGKV